MKKQYISADQLLADSIELAFRIIDSDFRPDLIVGIWRGGTPVGIAVQEVMEYLGFKSDHIAIRTSSYSGIGERNEVTVDCLDYLEQHLSVDDKLLLIDDVFDTGRSMEAIIKKLDSIYKNNMPEFRIATPYYKPVNNETGIEPHFTLHESSHWLVFPHEFIGLTDKEIIEEKPLPKHQKERLLFLKRRFANRR